MSKLEVDAIEPQSGTTLTLGASGDTITIPSGATLTNSGTATGFGKVLQVVSTNIGGTDISADGYVGTGASITPSSASNNVLIILTGYGEQLSGGASDYPQIELHKTTTSIATVNNAFTYQYTVGARVPFAINLLNAPSTTSSVQYRLYHDEISGGASYRYYQQNWTLIEIAG